MACVCMALASDAPDWVGVFKICLWTAYHAAPSHSECLQQSCTAIMSGNAVERSNLIRLRKLDVMRGVVPHWLHGVSAVVCCFSSAYVSFGCHVLSSHVLMPRRNVMGCGHHHCGHADWSRLEVEHVVMQCIWIGWLVAC